MTDIVERLRQPALYNAGQTDWEMRQQAADEIERLRVLNKALEDARSAVDRYIAALKKTNAAQAELIEHHGLMSPGGLPQ